MGRRELGALYLAIQGIATLLWWAVLLIAPMSRRLFLPAEWPDLVLTTLLLPDFLLFAGASLAASWAISKRQPWWKAVLLLHLGASGYATLTSIAIFLATREAALSVVLMLPAFLLSLLVYREAGR